MDVLAGYVSWSVVLLRRQPRCMLLKQLNGFLGLFNVVVDLVSADRLYNRLGKCSTPIQESCIRHGSIYILGGIGGVLGHFTRRHSVLVFSFSSHMTLLSLAFAYDVRDPSNPYFFLTEGA